MDSISTTTATTMELPILDLALDELVDDIDNLKAELSFFSSSAVRSSELDGLSYEVESLRTLMIVARVIASIAVAASVNAVYFMLRKNGKLFEKTL